MELLLNLVWLLLALPAYWLWRECKSAHSGRRFTSLQCLLALGCVLFILFPVVSATDDLHAMRAEMEESPVSKRSICQKSGDRSSAWKSQCQPAVCMASTSFFRVDSEWHPVLVSWFALPAALTIERTGRSPPVSFLE